jgi:hypothetical protein
MANAIAFAASLRKSLQAIDAAGLSGLGWGQVLSHEQRQERHCAFPGATSLFNSTGRAVAAGRDGYRMNDA